MHCCVCGNLMSSQLRESSTIQPDRCTMAVVLCWIATLTLLGNHADCVAMLVHYRALASTLLRGVSGSSGGGGALPLPAPGLAAAAGLASAALGASGADGTAAAAAASAGTAAEGKGKSSLTSTWGLSPTQEMGNSTGTGLLAILPSRVSWVSSSVLGNAHRSTSCVSPIFRSMACNR